MIKVIIFDFDGVVLDSVPIKTKAFCRLFEAFGSSHVDTFVKYNKENNGVSRYIKINYFFENIVNKPVGEEEVLYYLKRYSELTREELCDSRYLIEDCVSFIKNNYKKFNMHIASGADEEDLRHICAKLQLTPYFISIHGSPMPKNLIIKNLLYANGYSDEEVVLVGDSVNDYVAAKENNIYFLGCNNTSLRPLGGYLESINSLLEWSVLS